MSVIGLKKADCKNCYRCLKVCPVKSITFENDRAEIMPYECIQCGHCLEACPQNAKKLHSDKTKVLELLAGDKKVFVSLAPSFHAGFDFEDEGQVVTALLKLGFAGVDETVTGAALVSKAYAEILAEHKMDNALTTCCPAINNLVERHYPELIKYLLPVITPMVADARYIKEKYGRQNCKVVFVGPCIAKIGEKDDPMYSGDVDAVLTFEEVNEWLASKGIVVKELEPTPFVGDANGIHRSYPITDGIVGSVNHFGGCGEYDALKISGVDECIDVLKAIKNGELHNAFIEINACKGGCVYGPVVGENKRKRFQATIAIEKYAKKEDAAPLPEIGFSMKKQYIDKKHKEEMPTEEQIREILRKTGKNTPEDERNCGFCGYPTCRDKAIAVFQNKAKLAMCLPYMSELSNSMSNVILEETPNIIVAVDSDLKIVEFNQAAQDAFGLTRPEALQKYIYEVMDSTSFEAVLETGENITDNKVSYPHLNIVTQQNITYVPEHGLVIGVFKDITADEQQQEHLYKLRGETMDMAQKVIDKQMMVAQEIASLLGETTAETKVTLTKLKDMIVYDEQGE